MEKTQHVVNDIIERICGLTKIKLFKLIVTSNNWPSTKESHHLLSKYFKFEHTFVPFYSIL